MAGEIDARHRPLVASLIDGARQSDFYEALYLLEHIYASAVPIGGDGPASGEAVRLRPSVGLGFPPADIESIEGMPSKGRVQLTTAFLGLYGVESPLPSAYAEHLAMIADDPAGQRVRAFLDILHHRLLSLLYRGWKKYRVTGELAGDRVVRRVLSLAGLGGAAHGTPSCESPPQEARLLVWRNRSAVGLRLLVERGLGVPARVEEFVRRRAVVPTGARTLVGARSTELGTSFLVGRRVFDRNRVAICLEVPDTRQLMALLPGGPLWARLVGRVQAYCQRPIEVQVRLELGPGVAPRWRLGGHFQLGRSTWSGVPPTGARAVSFLARNDALNRASFLRR